MPEMREERLRKYRERQAVAAEVSTAPTPATRKERLDAYRSRQTNDVPERQPGAIESGVRGFASAFPQALGSALQTETTLLNAADSFTTEGSIPNTVISAFRDNPVQQARQKAGEYLTDVVGQRPQNTSGDLGNVVGQAVTTLIGGGIGGLATKAASVAPRLLARAGSAIGAAGAIAPQVLEGTYEEYLASLASNESLTLEDREQLAARGAAYATAGSMPVEYLQTAFMLGRVGSVLRNFSKKRALLAAIISAPTEGIEEGVQDVITRFIGKGMDIYDDDMPLADQETLYEMMLGTFGGLVVGGGGAIAGRALQRGETREPQPFADEPEIVLEDGEAGVAVAPEAEPTVTPLPLEPLQAEEQPADVQLEEAGQQEGQEQVVREEEPVQEEPKQDVRQAEVVKPEEPSTPDVQPEKAPEPQAVQAEPTEAAPESDEQVRISAKHRLNNLNRVRLGWNKIDAPEKVTLKQQQEDAIVAGIPERAEELAAQVFSNDKILTATETQGLVVRMAELSRDHDRASKLMESAVADADIAQHKATMDTLNSKFDMLSRAVFETGTAASRALGQRRAVINENYDFLSVSSRAKASKGSNLKKRESDRLKRDADRIKALEEEIVGLREANRRDIVKVVARRRPRKSQKDRPSIKSLAEEYEAMVKKGCEFG